MCEKIRVVKWLEGEFEELEMDLEHSSIAKTLGLEMRLCYYHELDDHVTIAARQGEICDGQLRRVRVFVKFVDSNPVHLSIDECKQSLAQQDRMLEDFD